jgi:hypothetical protein
MIRFKTPQTLTPTLIPTMMSFSQGAAGLYELKSAPQCSGGPFFVDPYQDSISDTNHIVQEVLDDQLRRKLPVSVAKGAWVLFGAGLIVLQWSCGICGNLPVNESWSPGRKYKAVTTKYSCGISSVESTELSILPAAAGPPQGKGNTFSIDNCDGATPVSSSYGGVIPLKVVWRTDQLLEITYPAAATVWKQEKSWADIRIEFHKAGASSSVCTAR